MHFRLELRVGLTKKKSSRKCMPEGFQQKLDDYKSKVLFLFLKY